MGHRVNAILNLVITELKNDATLSAYVPDANIRIWEGRFNDPKEFQRVASRPPYLFVAFMGDDFTEATSQVTYLDRMRIGVIAGDRSLVGKANAQTKSQGANDLIDDVKDALHKNALGQADIDGMFIKRRRPFVQTDQLTAYACEFELEFCD